MTPVPYRNMPATETRPYRGVIWHKAQQRFRVRIHTQGTYVYFGYYDDPKVAAQVYDVAACMVMGPEALLNFDGRLPEGFTETQILQPFARKGFDVHRLLENWRKRVGR